MYTLKIRWMRYENGDLADETTLFIAAEQVKVHGETTVEQMNKWPEGSFLDYRMYPGETATSTHEITKGEPMTSRLIEVEYKGETTWYLASNAWLLGPDGKTIERLTA